MNTIEGNKLIEKFVTGKDNDNHSDKYWIEWVKYHSSWDWLMPVYHKFNRLYLNNLHSESLDEFEKINENIDNALTLTYEIELFYNELVKGIQWYNSQPQAGDKN